DTGRVRHRALQVLARHPLRAADAGHLGAAMVVADLSGTVVPFVCFDSRLGRAAELEGLDVFPPPRD
ncbi:MAG TPA: VapC toxin family PIN domain ribonuclease, partial [Acidimicrobiia bacterium]|nr:VapC toxin family PIN domain ribonuclease [Acidimicrobiia bacterium]